MFPDAWRDGEREKGYRSFSVAFTSSHPFRLRGKERRIPRYFPFAAYYIRKRKNWKHGLFPISLFPENPSIPSQRVICSSLAPTIRRPSDVRRDMRANSPERHKTIRREREKKKGITASCSSHKRNWPLKEHHSSQQSAHKTLTGANEMEEQN